MIITSRQNLSSICFTNSLVFIFIFRLSYIIILDTLSYPLANFLRYWKTAPSPFTIRWL